MKDLLDLTGKVAIITGASSGMGMATALKFAEHGATVIAAARRKERLEELAKQNANIVPFATDVTSQDDIKKLVDFVEKEYEHIDILVNNAGIMDDMVPVADLTDDLWQKVFAVNVDGAAFLTSAVLKNMMKNDKGSIINIASVGGLYGGRAGAAYTASKHALVGLTKNTAFMYGREGIRCNAICPGAVATEIAQNSMKNPSKFGLEKMMSGMGLNPRTASAEEIANVALFLASDASSVLNGATIAADSGWTTY